MVTYALLNYPRTPLSVITLRQRSQIQLLLKSRDGGCYCAWGSLFLWQLQKGFDKQVRVLTNPISFLGTSSNNWVIQHKRLSPPLNYIVRILHGLEAPGCSQFFVLICFVLFCFLFLFTNMAISFGMEMHYINGPLHVDESRFQVTCDENRLQIFPLCFSSFQGLFPSFLLWKDTNTHNTHSPCCAKEAIFKNNIKSYYKQFSQE